MSNYFKTAGLAWLALLHIVSCGVSIGLSTEPGDKFNSPIVITAPHKESNIWINDKLLGKGKVEVSASALLKVLGDKVKISDRSTSLGLSRCTFGIAMDCFVLEDGSHPFLWTESFGKSLSVNIKYGKANWPLMLDSQLIQGDPYSAEIFFRERNENLEVRKIDLILDNALDGVVFIHIPPDCMPDFTLFSTVLQIHPSGDGESVPVFASSAREPGQALKLEIKVPKGLSERTVISGHYVFKKNKPTPHAQSSFGIRPRNP